MEVNNSRPGNTRVACEQMQTDYVMTCRAKSIIYVRRFVKSLLPERKTIDLVSPVTKSH
jgi:hypothetical protein